MEKTNANNSFIYKLIKRIIIIAKQKINFKMQIGDYKLFSVQTGLFKLDGGAMFGVVPKNLWQKTNPAGLVWCHQQGV